MGELRISNAKYFAKSSVDHSEKTEILNSGIWLPMVKMLFFNHYINGSRMKARI